MPPLLPEPSPAPVNNIHSFLDHDMDDDDDDADTASQRSISLSSPPESPRHSALKDFDARHADFRDTTLSPKRESHSYTEFGSDADSSSMFSHDMDHRHTGSSSASSIYDEPQEADFKPTYPPYIPNQDDRSSITSFTSTSSRKTRPESLLVNLPKGPIIHGVALVDFNHLIGPRVEYSQGDIIENEEVAKILPFLALPDGAHLSAEDFSYFHIVPSGPNPTTVFGISCNQQIASSALLVKPPDVTRSIVQKAVVILASKPVFGPMRDKLGVVTTALFNQRDFTDASILDDFASQLELSLRGQLTESGLYMGTNLRELVHVFRQRTLVLVKALMLQKRILFFGHPVELLCTYQYSLVALLPGLLQTLDDCGSPPLSSRAPTLSRPTSLKTSDPKSMMAFMGLPLDIFGRDAFFQPYLPLQQLELLKDTPSWLCGSTNSIVSHSKDIDLLINIETGSFEFRNPNLERLVALTPADRKWMDEIVTDVNESWDGHGTTKNLQFKGSEDYLRTKFEEYVFAALSMVKYQDFILTGEGSSVIITGGTGGDSASLEDFNPLWTSEFRKTNAYEVWNRITDPLIFDIIEPRHPCTEKPSVVSDIGLRLSEGIQELKLEQQLAPAREAVSRAVTVGSANFFKAVEGVRDRWAQSQRSDPSGSTNSLSTAPVEVSKADLDGMNNNASSRSPSAGLRSFSLLSRTPSDTSSQSPGTSSTLSSPTILTNPSNNLKEWGAGIGSFVSSRASMFGNLTRRLSEDSNATQTQSAQTKSGSSSPPLHTPETPTRVESEPSSRTVPLRKNSSFRATPERMETVSKTTPIRKNSLLPGKSGVENAYGTRSVHGSETALSSRIKNTPPPVQVIPVPGPGDLEREADEGGLSTPQPLKRVNPAINVTSHVISRPNGTPEPVVDAEVPTTPKPITRVGRSNSGGRPTAGLWDDHDPSILDDTTDGFANLPSSKGVHEKNDGEGLKGRQKVGHSDKTLSEEEEDTDAAYTAMAF